MHKGGTAELDWKFKYRHSAKTNSEKALLVKEITYRWKLTNKNGNVTTGTQIFKNQIC